VSIFFRSHMSLEEQILAAVDTADNPSSSSQDLALILHTDHQVVVECLKSLASAAILQLTQHGTNVLRLTEDGSPEARAWRSLPASRTMLEDALGTGTTMWLAVSKGPKFALQRAKEATEVMVIAHEMAVEAEESLAAAPSKGYGNCAHGKMAADKCIDFWRIGERSGARRVADLPKDTLFFALGFLDFQALGRLERVSRSWRDVVRTDDAWRVIHFVLGGTNRMAPMCSSLKSSTKVRVRAMLELPHLVTAKINIYDHKDGLPDVDIAIGKRISFLKRLVVPYCHLVGNPRSGIVLVMSPGSLGVLLLCPANCYSFAALYHPLAPLFLSTIPTNPQLMKIGGAFHHELEGASGSHCNFAFPFSTRRFGLSRISPPLVLVTR